MPETDSDASADTARFQAFAERDYELPSAWQMRAPTTKIWTLVGIMVVAAILASVLGAVLIK